jgi:uncharacterized membrane protein
MSSILTVKQTILFLSSIAGLYVSTYFTLIFYNIIKPNTKWVPVFCQLKENTCQLILKHRDARVFGIPNSFLGILYYGAMIITVVANPNHNIEAIPIVASWLTVGLSLYLAYSLFFVVKIVCPLCLFSHGINILIAIVITCY